MVAAVAVDEISNIAFDGNRLATSPGRSTLFRMVTVEGYVAKVVIVAHGQVVATHERSLEKHAMILDPIHYLATLGRKPAAPTTRSVFRDWKLPACFAKARAELQRLAGW